VYVTKRRLRARARVPAVRDVIDPDILGHREVEFTSADENKQGWWQTLPGVIAAVTATITALAGLVVAVKQTGWFDSKSSPAVSAVEADVPDAAAPRG
jgi:hypothetical protein